jgi:hypothetical protein
MQDIEFTVQENRLWMLQCRSGEPTGEGAGKIVVDLINEGLVDRNVAIKMVEQGHLDQLPHPRVIDNLECIYNLTRSQLLSYPHMVESRYHPVPFLTQAP